MCMLYEGIKQRVKTRKIKATGVYHERLATGLNDTGFCVYVANPYRCRKFVRGMGIMTKRDKVEAYMRACYAFFRNTLRREPPVTEIRYPRALSQRRDLLPGDAVREEFRLEK